MITHIDWGWTYEQALAAFDKAHAEGASEEALASLAVFGSAVLAETSYRSGDGLVLMDTIHRCGSRDIPFPRWLLEALGTAIMTIREFNAGSWDEVIGKPYPQGFKLKAARRRRERALPIWRAVRAEIAAGKAVDEDLFATVGKALAVSSSTARQSYYANKESFERWQGFAKTPVADL